MKRISEIPTILIAVGSLLAVATGSARAEDAENARAMKVRDDMIALAKQLNTNDEALASNVRAQLTAYGPRVLPFLTKQFVGDSSSGLNRAALVVRDVQAVHGPTPCIDKDLEFLVLTDNVWRIPEPGSTRELKFQVKVTNRGEQVIVFGRSYEIDIGFWRPDYKTITVERKSVIEGEPHRQRFAGLPNRLKDSPPLALGESFLVSDIHYSLRRGPGNEDIFLDREEDGLIESMRVTPGLYLLHVACVHTCLLNTHALVTPSAAPRWTGIAVLRPVAIEIR